MNEFSLVYKVAVKGAGHPDAKGGLGIWVTDAPQYTEGDLYGITARFSGSCASASRVFWRFAYVLCGQVLGLCSTATRVPSVTRHTRKSGFSPTRMGA